MTSPTPTSVISRSGLRYRKTRDHMVEALLLAAGAILPGMTLVMNGLAIPIRYRSRKKINW